MVVIAIVIIMLCVVRYKKKKKPSRVQAKTSSDTVPQESKVKPLSNL